MHADPETTTSDTVHSAHTPQLAEYSVLRTIIAIVTLLILCAGIVVFTLADRIVQRFAAVETLAEEKQSAMLEARNRAALEERPRLTREEKTDFITIVDFETDDLEQAMITDEETDGIMIASCLPTVKLTTIGRDVVWSASVIGGPGEYTYTWSGDENLNGTEQIVTKKYSASGTKKASVIVASNGATNSPLSVVCSDVVRVQTIEMQ